MSGPSYTGTVSGYRVTQKIEGAQRKMPTYPLLPGDLLIEREDGTFYKFAPGLGVEGFILTEEQKATLGRYEDQAFGIGGMDYFLSPEDAA